MRFAVAFRLAVKETRRSRGALFFCIFSVALGVAALTAVRSVADSLQQSVAAEGRQIFGADLSVSGRQPLDTPLVRQLTSELVAQGARYADGTSFSSMLARVGQGKARKQATLVRVRAVGDGFPFYGVIATTPEDRFNALSAAPSVIADSAVLRELGVAPGDHVKLGNLDAVVLAAIVKQAGGPASEFSFAPFVFIHQRYVQQTGLLQTGSRVEYERLFALPQSLSAPRIKEQYWGAVSDAKLEIQTYEESAAGVQRFLGRLATYLTTLGLIVLLLGALGIGSALHALMKQKLDNAAILRCLGATPAGVFQIYALLSVIIAALGSVTGGVLGAIAPVLLLRILKTWTADFLPGNLVLHPTLGGVLGGVALGLIATLAFTVLPLWQTATVAPLRVLGRDVEASAGTATSWRFATWRSVVSWRSAIEWRTPAILLAALLVVSAAFAFELHSPEFALMFSAAISVVLGLLALVSQGLRWGARRFGQRLKNYPARQGIANLHRPGNQTLPTLIAVGLGTTLLCSIATVEHSLRQSLNLATREDLPNLFIVEVLPEQFQGVNALLLEKGATHVDMQPMISGRIHAINGKAIDVSQVERNAGKRTWQDRMRTREYFFSYREQLVPSEAITAGRFWTGRPLAQEVSIEDQFARSLNVHLGDTMTLDIQGLPLDAKVTSIRQVRWQAMRPNTIVLLSPGAIEDAPKMYVGSLRLPDETQRYELQGALVQKYPNLSVIDVNDAADTVVSLLSRIAQMFTLVGFLAIAVGGAAAAGAMVAGRNTRERESILLKVLGASPQQRGRILLTESTTLALLGAGAGWLLAEGLSRTLLPLLFETEAVVPYPTVISVVSLTIVFNVAVSVLSANQVSKSAPLDVLRA